MGEEKRRMRELLAEFINEASGGRVYYIGCKWLFEVHSIRLEYIWWLICWMCEGLDLSPCGLILCSMVLSWN
jgi:hypothetical protein